MPTKVLKLFAGPGTVTDGQSGDYMLPPLKSIKMKILMHKPYKLLKRLHSRWPPPNQN